MASNFSFDNDGANSNAIGSGGDDGNIIDPATIAGPGNGSNGDSGADEYIRDDAGNILYSPTGRPRKRRKSRNNAKSGSAQNHKDLGKNIDRLSAMLGFAHYAISNVTRIDELKLDKVESDMLATSVADVMSAFDIEVSDKAMAISGLVSACGSIYGPRIVTYNLRKKREKADKETPIVFPSKTAQFEETPVDPFGPNLSG